MKAARPRAAGPPGARPAGSYAASYAIILFCIAATGGLAYMSMRVRQLPPTGHASLDPCRSALHNERSEMSGAVVQAGRDERGVPGLVAASAHDCCGLCQENRDCNVWVWCADPSQCGMQCWLKRVNAVDDATAPDPEPSVPWTSGSLSKAFRRSVESLPDVDASARAVALTTPLGDIIIELMPEWSAESVEYVRRLAQTPGLCSGKCEFYRAEQGFLLQGSLEAFIPPNTVTSPGPKVMERGEIGWAGGSSGPDFFIYLGDQPATHWGRQHTVWGRVADDRSLGVVEQIVAAPFEQPWLSTNNPMKMLVERVRFDVAKVSLP